MYNPTSPKLTDVELKYNEMRREETLVQLYELLELIPNYKNINIKGVTLNTNIVEDWIYIISRSQDKSFLTLVNSIQENIDSAMEQIQRK